MISLDLQSVASSASSIPVPCEGVADYLTSSTCKYHMTVAEAEPLNHGMDVKGQETMRAIVVGSIHSLSFKD